jgi:hypothetical protein
MERSIDQAHHGASAESRDSEVSPAPAMKTQLQVLKSDDASQQHWMWFESPAHPDNG